MESENGFTIPEGYFQSARERILSKTINGKALEMRDGFLTPANYFESSKKEILSKTTLKKEKVKNRFLEKLYIANATIHPYIRIAAIALIIGGAGIFLFQLPQFQSPAQRIAFEEPSTEEILAYVENSNEFSVNEISYITPAEADLPVSLEEDYLINQADEQLITEEL